MAIHLRQICLVADRLQPAIDELSAVFFIPTCHVDPAVEKFGLENTLLLTGSQFIEVVAPLQNSARIAYESDRDTWNIMQLHPADMGAALR